MIVIFYDHEKQFKQDVINALNISIEANKRSSMRLKDNASKTALELCNKSTESLQKLISAINESKLDS